MNVEIIRRELDYYVLEVRSRTDNKGKEYLTWDYSNASYFIILKLGINFNLDDINTKFFFEKLKKGLEHSFGINGVPAQKEIELTDEVKVDVITLNQYRRTNSWYYEPYPMKVCVLCGEYRDDLLRVHVPEDISMCSTFVPAKVNIDIKKEAAEQTRRGWLGGLRQVFSQPEQLKNDVYHITVKNLSQNYTEGIFYRIKGSKIIYPITNKMSLSKFKVEIPIGSSLEFFVSDDYINDFVINERRE